ncbi:hypothetical protein [Pseudonocardia spinosispora]|uniref:hypothetical protein n=1 Tax=Pseudonocardia spinosispora TaxID=103441 RepID=UPI00041FC486|nr:hypothetical protein [Pseudonocardia spinosispora]
MSPRTPGPARRADQLSDLYPPLPDGIVPSPRSAPDAGPTQVIPTRHRAAAKAPTGRHAIETPRTRRANPWRLPVISAVVVALVALLVYGTVAAFRTSSPPSDDTTAAPTVLPDPAVPPAPVILPGPDLGPTKPVTPPKPAVTPVKRFSPPSSMMVTSASRSGNAESLTLPGGAKFQVYDNFPMAGNAKVTRAVIVVHGTGRNAEGYYTRMMSAAKAAGAADNTMVVSPWFKGDEDDKVASGEASWENDAWKQGYPSQKPAGLSSFTVMDNLVASLASPDRFPNLKHITITGHSAGGQFTQRYAAFGKAPSQMTGIDFNFAAMNPSSYVYFDNKRPNSNGTAFTVPSSSSCSDYNSYKYGLAGRQSYPGQLTAAQAMAQYASRKVTIVNGSADTVDNGDLDTDCGAMLEGPNREARGQYFLKHFLSLQPNAKHNRLVVPGVAHESEEMFASPVVKTTLFGSSS